VACHPESRQKTFVSHRPGVGSAQVGRAIGKRFSVSATPKPESMTPLCAEERVDVEGAGREAVWRRRDEGA
jgi:hypothetical protein